MENKRTIELIINDIKTVSTCIDTLNTKGGGLSITIYMSKSSKISSFIPLELIGIEVPKEEDIMSRLKIKLDSLTDELNKALFDIDN